MAAAPHRSRPRILTLSLLAAALILVMTAAWTGPAAPLSQAVEARSPGSHTSGQAPLPPAPYTAPLLAAGLIGLAVAGRRPTP